ncbi:MAG: hypothetical protein ABW127_19165 [Candidatus Thiodiazotropha endolucinida]
MAGDWVKFQIDTFEKPEVIKIADDLGIPEEHAAGCLLKVWCWFDRQSRDGHVLSVTEKYIDRLTRVTDFAQVMQKVGWLILSDDGLTIPNFDRHNGTSAKTRVLAAERKRKERSLNNRDVDVTREEKRRIKENTKRKSELEAPSCPHAEIIRIYHENLPELSRVVESRWSGSQRAKDLETRWKEDIKHQKTEFWQWFFQSVRTNPHWMGDNGWKANLGWLLKRSNFDKVIERGVNVQHQGAV